jgi:anti-sigma factor RsiW
MTDSPPNCTDGRYAAEILAYLDGELSEQDRTAFEAHVQRCRACSEELQNLRAIRSLLRAHPESFHPDPAELYRYVAQGRVLDAATSAHLQDCEACRNAVDVIEEMMSVGARAPRTAGPMPTRLMRQLEALYPEHTSSRGVDQPVSWLAALLRRPFRVPVLAMGTAAAVVIAAFLVAPLWHTLKEVPQPGSIPSSEAPVPLTQPLEERSKDALQATPEEASPAAEEPRERKQFRALPGQGAPMATRLKEGEDSERVSTKTRAAKKAPSGQNVGEGAPGWSLSPNGTIAGAPSPQSRAAAGLPKPQAAPPASAAYQSPRETVLLRVEGPEGQHLPALASSIPEEVRQRYNFVEEGGTRPQWEKGKGAGAPDKRTERDRGAASKAPMRITIRIHQTGGGYTVEGRLYEKGSMEETKTITDLDVPLEKLPQKVGGLVQDLLPGL